MAGSGHDRPSERTGHTAVLAGWSGEDIGAVLDWFGIAPAGNFEGRSIPNRIAHRGDLRRPERIENARRLLGRTP